MFYNCSKLNSLNLSKLDTSRTKSMANIFFGCSTLTSLDLSNFETSQVKDMSNMFYDCSNLEYINLKTTDIHDGVNINNIFPLTSKNLVVCTENEYENFLKILGRKIIFYCDENHLNKYNCYMKNSTLDNKYDCEICQNNFLYNESFYFNSYINCFEPKPVLCYNSCKTCEIEGNETNNNCIECKNDFIFELNITNSKYKNCYLTNPFEPTTSIVKNVYTSELNPTNKEDTSEYHHYISELITNVYINTDKPMEKKTEIIQDIKNNLISKFNLTGIGKGEDKKMFYKDKMIILTSTENQKNNEKDYNITMNLCQCENILKKNYNISSNDSLYILQIISKEDGMKIPKLEYEIYYPSYDYNSWTKLNLTYCKNEKIEISTKVKINDSLDKYNPKSNYYNDFCTKAKSESGTDITLKDRRNEFVDNNMSLCEENCDLIEYNPDKEKVKCSCNIKLNIPDDFDIKFNKKDFFKSFIDVKNIINLNVMKCYKTVLKLNSLINNYGFFILCSIIILYFTNLFIFIAVSFRKIKKKIHKIVFELKTNGNPIKKRKDKIKKKRRKTFHDIDDIKKSPDKFNKIFYLKEKNKLKHENFNQQITENNISNSYNKISSSKNIIVNIKDLYTNKKLSKKEFVLNQLNYGEALKLDHRSYCEFYYSLIKYFHPILFSFGTYNDYNSRIIKMFLFFFSFSLDFTLNALFFTDYTIHKIYEEKGKFNFLYQIPQILYSTLISRLIDSIIRNFALTQDNIITLKRKVIKKRHKEYKKLKRILKIKFILFYITTFLSLVLFWYYITCFCGIYINSQIHLIKDSIFSLITSLLIPFVLYLMTGIFRISSLRVQNGKRKILYNFSLFLVNWFC